MSKKSDLDQLSRFNEGPAPEEIIDTIKPRVEEKPKGLVKVQWNGLFYAPELKKFVDPETDKPISDHTFEDAQIMGIPANPLDYPSDDTVDWILEVVKGLSDFWYAKKLAAPWYHFDASHKQWLLEVTKRNGANLVFAPGMFAASLIKHGEQIALQGLNDSFPKG